MCSRSGAPHRERGAGGALSRGLPLCLPIWLTLALLLAGCAATGGAGAASAPTPTRTSASSGAFSGAAGWSSYRDPTYGFVVAYPSDAVALGTTTIGATSLARWRIANPQGGGDDAILEVTATTQASAGICAHASDGTPVALAGGVTGYQQGAPSDATPTSAASQVAVIVLHSGLLTILTLTGQGQPGAFSQRWGGVWDHILATFQPGQGPAGAQPCDLTP